jgi:hypothetical protein
MTRPPLFVKGAAALAILLASSPAADAEPRSWRVVNVHVGDTITALD